ncbi:MAG: nucleotidyltransferase domain-containing protein, partial [Treponema sp.]|nr:nucleotidyltransferase domain-containing protein [Treponema sp.]
MKNKFGLPDEVFAKITDTLKKYPQIKKAVIFGSRAKGSNKQYSDIDIAIFADTDENI